jgi:glucose/arabinose dehydrogenase
MHRLSFIFLTLILFSSNAIAQIRISELATNLDDPVDISHAGDGSGRLFFVLQRGKIVVWNGSRVLTKPFLDITSSVSCCGERGLLSLAFHPNHKTNGFFYVLYTNTSGDVVPARFKVSSANRNVADAGSRKILLTVSHRNFGNHNGGELQFGRDGCLYFSIGDGGGAGDTANNAQNLGTLLGKLLRINVDSGNPYGIPQSNPFRSRAGAKQEIWAFGLRNLWRFSFDRLNGNLYLADVGQNSWEEINFQTASSNGGENYGWRRMEGRHCFNPPNACNNGTLQLPIIEYSHSQGCSITGGYVYRGNKIPAIYGKYLFADYCSGILWSAEKKNGVWSTSRLLHTGKNISTFGEDES